MGFLKPVTAPRLKQGPKGRPARSLVPVEYIPDSDQLVAFDLDAGLRYDIAAGGGGGGGGANVTGAEPVFVTTVSPTLKRVEIRDASQASKGSVRFANAAEVAAGASGLAISAADLKGAIDGQGLPALRVQAPLVLARAPALTDLSLDVRTLTPLP